MAELASFLALQVDGSVVKQSSRTSPLEKSVFYPELGVEYFCQTKLGKNGSSHGWCELHDMAETAAGHRRIVSSTVPRSHWCFLHVQIRESNCQTRRRRSFCHDPVARSTIWSLVYALALAVPREQRFYGERQCAKPPAGGQRRPIGCMTSTMGENKSGTLVKARSKRLTGTPSEFKCVGLFTSWLMLKESIKSFRAEPWEFVTSSEYQSLCFALKSPSRTMSVSAALSRTDSRYW